MDVVLDVGQWEAEERPHEHEFGRRSSSGGSRRVSREYRRPTIEEVRTIVLTPEVLFRDWRRETRA